ncbi:MAG: TRAP transporter large permease subunit, partial [Dongiaceae bacterium]
TEMGIVTPPLGISAFIVKNTLNDPRITLEDVYRGSYPFLGIMFITLVLVVSFPWLSVGLVR